MKRNERFARRRRDGEVCAAKDAIRYQCSECLGHQPAEVEGCTDPGCWLYPHRLGRPAELRRKLSPERAAAGAERLRLARAARAGDRAREHTDTHDDQPQDAR